MQTGDCALWRCVYYNRGFQQSRSQGIAPKFFKHTQCNTRGERTLDHCYTPFWNAYKSLPSPPLGKLDHSSILLLPAYRQKLKRETTALRTIQFWSDKSDSMLQDCFDYVDWDMFPGCIRWWHRYLHRHSHVLRKCIEDVVPTKTIPNQKPWINADVRVALNARTSAFNSDNVDDYKQASYNLRKTIKTAKHQSK